MLLSLAPLEITLHVNAAVRFIGIGYVIVAHTGEFLVVVKWRFSGPLVEYAPRFTSTVRVCFLLEIKSQLIKCESGNFLFLQLLKTIPA